VTERNESAQHQQTPLPLRQERETWGKDKQHREEG
jgi:hypothetical protein